MGNGQRQQCAGTTASGVRCQRKALKGSDYCGLKSHQDQGGESRARTRPLEAQFSPDFQYLVDLCRSEISSPSDDSMRMIQWARLLLDSVRHAKEELRALEAQFVTYHITYEDPLKPSTEPPPLPQPPKGAGNG